MTIGLPNAAPANRGDHHRAAGTADQAPRPPLAVDLDGTLTFADTLHEGILDLARRSPLQVAVAMQSLWDGKAAVKQSIAANGHFDPATLPYDPDLLAYLRAEHAMGRQLGLFTAADQSIADAVAAHLGLFTVVRGSDGTTNLSGAAKAVAIEAAFGPNFAYAGDSMTDMPVFSKADTVILAGPVDRLRAALPATVQIETSFPHPPPGLAVWARALRLSVCPATLLGVA